MLVKLLVVAVFAAVACQATEEDVLEWADGEFAEELRRHDNTLVMFYAPWCGHCKQLKPEYVKAAELLRDNDPPITLAKVDCTESGKDTCNKYSVNGYPTLKIFAKDEVVNDYNGPRDAYGIAKYMKAQVGPASKELLTAEDVKEFMNSEEIGVIGYFEKEDSSLSVSYHSVAKKLREKFRFGHSNNAESGNKIVIHRPKLLHNKFEPNEVVYSGADSINDISEFVKQNYYGLVGLRTRDNMEAFKKPLVVAYYSVDYVKNPKGTNYWRNRIRKVAKDFPEYTFAIASKDEFQNELNEYDIDYVKSDKPIVLVRDERNQKFMLRDDFSVESFEKFMKDLQADALEPYQKSEPIPENTGNVKVAVAKNFDEIVTNNNKDTLIEFYAPWCGHCKKLEPIYNELGDKLADEDVEIVKMDATANDVPYPYEVRGYPSLFWVPKNSKDNPQKYEGGRKLEEFIEYIAKHATNQLKGYDRSGKPIKAPQDEL
ncbi:PREDICTED: protein disulfide-isomerase A3 [Ceratosolen solmsi marchali]|uniref:Protein disulfide-isomerase n=1 Tax=Ceratosolen solmsi marchali TaxID=326594 RepID=A0AAJ6VKA6_9HYME|nr:PREDICTED: protein disulfide-isomerase A3 [Ceratosolen solmsi marchali]